MNAKYAVIFSSQLNPAESPENKAAAYENMATKMAELAKTQEGFLGLESARGVDGVGITVSYWATIEDIMKWRKNSEHQVAQRQGREVFYSNFTVRICRIEREYDFGKS